MEKGNFKLRLVDANLSAEYKEEWKVYSESYSQLWDGTEMLRPTLYRVGGICTPKFGTDRFLQLLKYSEAYYDREIYDKSKSSLKHLRGVWCILDAVGNEIVEFEQFATPYLVKDSCIYSLNNNYVNIETGEFYCKSYDSMESDKFLFLDNAFDNDKTRRGIFKINKEDGTYVIFKKN